MPERAARRHRAARPLHDHLQRPAAWRPQKGAWWLDRAFGRIDISREARVGENEVTLKASPFTIYHEIEPAYVLGDFALEAAAERLRRSPPIGRMTLGPWKDQGHPFYSEGVVLHRDLQRRQAGGGVPGPARALVRQRRAVTVNGQPAGFMLSAPWTLDVTRWIQPGRQRHRGDGDRHAEEHARAASRRPAARHRVAVDVPEGPESRAAAGARTRPSATGLFEPFVLVQSHASRSGRARGCVTVRRRASRSWKRSM